MRNPLKRTVVIFDFAEVIERMANDLTVLHNHVLDHCYHEDQTIKASEITRAIGMLRRVAAEEMLLEESTAMADGTEEEKSATAKAYHERMQREWNECWNYIRDNMRKWWC